MKALLSFMLPVLCVLACQLKAQDNGQLVIFIQDGRSISQDFKRNALSDIKRLAKDNALSVKVLDASKGAPKEVTYTPAIFYCNGKTSTLFNGRYSDTEQLNAFINSKGKIQPVQINRPVQQVSWNIGRATLNATMKINPLSGNPPKRRNFNAQKFEKEAYASILQGMEFFRALPASEGFGPSKSFHMEFFPTVQEGVLLIQMKLFSEHDLKTPIFVTKIPSGSEWKEWEVAFEKSGNRIEKALIAQISNWDNGDGFDTLKENTPVNTWTEALAYLPVNAGFQQKTGEAKE